MAAIQEGGWAAKLFSSALFCLWLSIASVSVWFDAAPTTRAMPVPMTVQDAARDEDQGAPTTPAATPAAGALAPEQSASRTIPATDRLPDAA